MDSYLDLAAQVLKHARRPLSAKIILQTAYQLSIVPKNLYGKTQFKTLHARIAEDIRRKRSRSIFVRTDPGRFFLRPFLTDVTIPARYKREFPALPRADQLRNFRVVCFKRCDWASLDTGAPRDTGFLDAVPLFSRRLAEVASDGGYLFLRIFVIVTRLQSIVVRRAMHAPREMLGGKVSLGALGYVKEGDRTLFSLDPIGLRESSLRTLTEQLDLTDADADALRGIGGLHSLGLLPAASNAHENSVAAIIVCHCPESIDPLARYDGGGSLYWHQVDAQLNDLDALDPWSRQIYDLGLLRRSVTAQEVYDR